MLNAKTVFVLGAGASEPYGFPAGTGLRRALLKELPPGVHTSPPTNLQLLLHKLRFTPERIEEFRRALSESGKVSVDSFLEHRPDFLDIGKAAMAASLLPCEQHNSLFGLDAAQGENWYEYLFNKLATNYEDLGKNNVAFLTFNYDRSLEYYLTTALQSAYRKTFAEAASTVRQFRIRHVYGDLGELTEEDAAGWRRVVRLDVTRVAAAASRIKIIHDENQDQQFAEARQFLDDAEIICFLGFGFHPTNVERLLKGVRHKDKGTALSTAFGMLNADRASITRVLAGQARHTSLGDENEKTLHFLRNSFYWW